MGVLTITHVHYRRFITGSSYKCNTSWQAPKHSTIQPVSKLRLLPYRVRGNYCEQTGRWQPS